LTETQTSKIVVSVIDALRYLHAHSVIHRDLKPANILFGIDGKIKIADFGLAFFGKDATKSCGTPAYIAPEVITAKTYNYKCDLWSLGVMIFVMLTGYFPFDDASIQKLYQLIIKGKYNMKRKEFEGLSDDAKHLISCLLETDLNTRYSTKELTDHRWVY
jgi:serine/threonine protein kinase